MISTFTSHDWLLAAIAIGTTAGVILRPFSWPEYVWAVSGAALLVVLRLLTPADALAGVGKGADVYLFLTGMMLLSELARAEGLFDWLAAQAVRRSNRSASRLFLLVYGVGTIVTVFLSNDATAVVLTPAVAAVVKAAKVEEKLPYLFVCAFIANAASFVLPISNPANLVIYGSHMPPLLRWLPQYTVPSLASILATFAVLRWHFRGKLTEEVGSDIELPTLSAGAKMAALGILGTGVVLLASSAFDIQLGLPTALAGLVTALIVLPRARTSVREIAGGISWGVLPLVAGLFVLVEALEKAGLTHWLATLLHGFAERSQGVAAWATGVGLALVSNVVNNLPAGLIAGGVVEQAKVPELVRSAVLIGIDLGPNLSVTGSLATLLWLVALRREGEQVSAGAFLKVGALVMPPALVLALAAAALTS